MFGHIYFHYVFEILPRFNCSIGTNRCGRNMEGCVFDIRILERIRTICFGNFLCETINIC